jgi:prepilin-type N-terminal cleavage/methylation domain-containing protein
MARGQGWFSKAESNDSTNVIEPRSKERVMKVKKQQGFSLIEILIVIAIIGILAGIAFVSGRQILRGQQEIAAPSVVQQSVWQGATGAASRGISIKLMKAGSVLKLVNAADDKEIRRFEFSDEVTTNIPEGQVLLFLPTGKVDTASLAALPQPLTITTSNNTYKLTVSLIGEVKVEVN